MNPRNTVFDAKRLIGRQFGDKTVQEDMKVLISHTLRRLNHTAIDSLTSVLTTHPAFSAMSLSLV